MGGGGSCGGQKALDHFELFGLAGHIPILQGDQDWLAIFAIKPIIGFHRGLWTNGVGKQILLEQVRLQGVKNCSCCCTDMAKKDYMR